VIALRAFLQRQSRRLLILAGFGLVFIAVALAHSGAGEDHMAGDQMAQAISTCLAVLQGGVGLLLAGLVVRARRLARAPRSIAAPAGPAGHLRPRLTPIRPRAGPAVLQVFRS
jgi:hypothetical protein